MGERAMLAAQKESQQQQMTLEQQLCNDAKENFSAEVHQKNEHIDSLQKQLEQVRTAADLQMTRKEEMIKELLSEQARLKETKDKAQETHARELQLKQDET